MLSRTWCNTNKQALNKKDSWICIKNVPICRFSNTCDNVPKCWYFLTGEVSILLGTWLFWLISKVLIPSLIQCTNKRIQTFLFVHLSDFFISVKPINEKKAMQNTITLCSLTLCLRSCRFGFDVPVILRSSDETESILPTPERQMVQVTNPFGLEMGSGPASVTGKDSNGQ